VGVAALALAVSGCAEERLPLRQDAVVVAPDVGFRMDDGAVLPGRVWHAVGFERAVVVALHGFGDSRDAWEHAGPRLAAAGISVYAYDQRGFGAAPGRGHWAGTDRMVADAAEVAAAVARAEPGVPLYVMGESMGGAVAMVMMAGDAPARHGVDVAGTILLAPAVWGRGQMNPLVVAALDVADTFAPEHRLTGREIPLHVEASDDRAELIKLSRDPLTLAGSSVSMLSGLVELMTRAQAAAGHLRGPVLYCYGAKDQLVPAAATASAWAKLPGEDRRAYYANGFHLTLRDLDHRAVEGDVVAWIAHPAWPLPSGADVLAAGWTGSRDWEGTPPYPLPGAFDDVGGPTREQEERP
jgi:alpha-beta hydrolase superfamily lysophospholipase